MGKKFSFPRPNRSAEDLKRRTEQRGTNFDSYVKDIVSLWRPSDGQNRIRILPPTWEGAKHYGLDIYLHFGVGADNQSYLCLEKMKREPCPICEERARVNAKGDQEAARQYAPKKRVMVYMIDRKAEEDGVKIWAMPWTLDRDLAERQIDKDTNEVLLIDDPEEGYDVMFSREAKGGSAQFAHYVGIDIARRPSPLHQDEDTMREWLEFIVDNPLDQMLNYFDYDHIKHVFHGGIESDTHGGDSSSGLDDDGDYDEDKVQSLKSRLRSGKKRDLPRDDGEKDEEEEDIPFDMSEDDDEKESSVEALKRKYRSRRAG